MGKVIIITEKPSVAMEYAKVLRLSDKEKHDGYISGYAEYLNSDVQITWAVGHLIELASVTEQTMGKVLTAGELEKNKERWSKSQLPILPQGWLYKPKTETLKQFKVIDSLYRQKDIDCIFYAGDSGREGIYIQALIRNQIFGKAYSDVSCPKNVSRERVVWIDSFTEEAILNGIRDAKDYAEYKDMIESGYKRAIWDWLIGMNVTQAITLMCKKLVRVGRVMTPTLAIVVDRQREIDAFKVTDYYGVNASTVGAKWKADEQSRYHDSPILFNEGGFKNKTDATEFIRELEKDNRLSVKKVAKTRKKENAPLLFNLADLQAYCSKTYHISPDTTLQIAQSLYESKRISYPRTDARVLSSAMAKEIRSKTGNIVPNKYVDDSKITDHYAIVPIDVGVKEKDITGYTLQSSLTDRVYADICKRYLAIFEPAYEYDSYEVVYEHIATKERFYSNGKTIINNGWKRLYGADSFEDFTVPKEGNVTESAYELNAMQTTPPAQFTTGTLILAMEKAGKLIEDEELREQIKGCGIGTSATRAGIIEKLCTNGYIETDKKQRVSATDFGCKVTDIVRDYDNGLASPVKTAEFEEQLNSIALHKGCTVDFDGYIRTLVEKILSGKTQDMDKPKMKYHCPSCKSDVKYGKYGWYCSCGFNFPLVFCGHTFTERDFLDYAVSGSTKKYRMKSKAGKSFMARLTYNKETNKSELKFT